MYNPPSSPSETDKLHRNKDEKWSRLVQKIHHVTRQNEKKFPAKTADTIKHVRLTGSTFYADKKLRSPFLRLPAGCGK